MTGQQRASPTAIMPAKAGIQYAAADRFRSGRLWNIESLAFADDDD